MEETKHFLESHYNDAMSKASGKKEAESPLPQPVKEHLDEIINMAESSKAVMTVVATSLVYKCLHPEQDVRLHQSSIPDGYSGRTFDSNYITPFLKEHRFPAMAASGWLTRSLEQKVAYDRNYTGAIKPKKLKDAFLDVMEHIESGTVSPEEMFDYLLQRLIILRDSKVIKLARPRNLPISGIVQLLDKHFHAHYKAPGASRLPVLAIYAIYQCLFESGTRRYSDKQLLSLESHTSADARSGRLGDIDVAREDGTPFETVEVKFDIAISHNIVVTAKEKIQPTTVDRYYILSTKGIASEDKNKIEEDIQQIKNTHGCQLIINGILPTLKYYLRLLDDPSALIAKYTELLETDTTIKFEHKQMWNDLVSKI